ncbi:HNH endonuclease signature motif containing protein [Kribbella shirazensis]|uniref:HNH nuclease domain-containing protein n=1 Tax=Kribbella shirazensis TaxID=1105143 RepID=A0A7X5VD35_9ACTN|nr:HNH endonuclease signature motif containing protein [Kribbella shirazensis]NIK58978.1 hypothetical protein [Kribbella shirazensis]
MEILGERPAWAMSGSEKLSTLDAVVAERARLKVVELQLIAELDRDGDAQQIGAGDTARLLSERYRLDLPTARRTVRTATGLTKHPATAAALPDPATPFPNPATARPDTDRTDTDRTDADRPDADRPDADGPDADLPDADGPDADRPDEADGAGAGLRESGGWRVYPAQAEAILSVLAKIPTTVPVENVEFAEQQLITLAATHTPSELRAAGKKIRDLLDPDGPEPDEKLAYSRESLTWKNADQGVTFRGYLACENAELFRTLIHAGARPHKTVDGEPDPRPRSKRQADALTTILNTAASTSTSTTTVTTTAATPATPATPAATTTAATTTATAATAATTTAGAGAGARPGARAEAGGRGQSEPSAPPDGSDAPTPTEPIALLEPAQDPLPDVDTADALATARSEPADGTDGPGGAGGAGGASGSGAGGPVADQPPAADARGRADADIGAGTSIVAGHGAKPHISVTIDYNDLKTAAANATGELVFGDTLSAATLRRLACDAEILPIVLGSKSQPLDVGTSQRLVTRPMRRALNARDKGCVVCGAPPIQCEAHHLKHWIDGGITAVSNLVLLCKRHHLDLHSGHWQIRITDGIVHVTRPTWADPTHIPRNRYRPPLITDQPPTSPPTAPWASSAEPPRV